MEMPLVTIAIATADDEARIEPCLRCALGQDYPADRIEIVVADAMSMDATREMVLRVAADETRVRLVDNPERTRAAALNAILRASHGEIIVPLDPGGEYGKTHVTKCVAALSGSSADHLAIAPRTAGRTLVERALSAAQKTKLAFAGGGALARDTYDDEETRPTVLGAVRRKVFERVGMFDPGTRIEEDVELSRRITRDGGGVAVRKDIVVHRADARSFRDLFKRHYEIGKGRARRTVKDKKIDSVDTIAPLAMVAVGGALAATSTVQPITPVALGLYALATGKAAVRVAKGEGILTIPIAWAAYPVMHLAQGVGVGSGFVRALVKPDWSTPELVPEPT